MSSSKRPLQLLSSPSGAVKRTLYPVLGSSTQWSLALNGPQLFPRSRWAQCPCQQAEQSSANQQTQQCHRVPALPCFSI